MGVQCAIETVYKDDHRVNLWPLHTEVVLFKGSILCKIHSGFVFINKQVVFYIRTAKRSGLTAIDEFLNFCR